jgi:hypothetical protein
MLAQTHHLSGRTFFPGRGISPGMKAEKFSINSKKVNTISTYGIMIPGSGYYSSMKKIQESQYLDADL